MCFVKLVVVDCLVVNVSISANTHRHARRKQGSEKMKEKNWKINGKKWIWFFRPINDVCVSFTIEKILFNGKTEKKNQMVDRWKTYVYFNTSDLFCIYVCLYLWYICENNGNVSVPILFKNYEKYIKRIISVPHFSSNLLMLEIDSFCLVWFCLYVHRPWIITVT